MALLEQEIVVSHSMGRFAGTVKPGRALLLAADSAGDHLLCGTAGGYVRLTDGCICTVA